MGAAPDRAAATFVVRALHPARSAQATWNTGNVYVRNEATGNGVADYAIDP